MLQDIDVVMLILGGLKQSLDSSLQVFVQLSDDLVSAWIIVIDRLLGTVEFGCRVDRSNSKRAHRCILDLLKEVSLLTSEDSHTIAFIHEEDTIGACTQHDTLLIYRTNNDQLVEDTNDWAVTSRPTKLARICLLSFLVIINLFQIGLHDNDSTCSLCICIQGEKVPLGVEGNELDLSKRVRFLILAFIVAVVTLCIAKLTLVTVVHVLVVFGDQMEAFDGVCDEELDRL